MSGLVLLLLIGGISSYFSPLSTMVSAFLRLSSAKAFTGPVTSASYLNLPSSSASV